MNPYIKNGKPSLATLKQDIKNRILKERERELFSTDYEWGHYEEEVEKLKRQDPLNLIASYVNNDTRKMRVILPELTEKTKRRPGYTLLLDDLINTLIKEDNNWHQRSNAQLLAINHPCIVLATKAIEVIISHDLGEKHSYDISFQVCDSQGKCRYPPAQFVYSPLELERYWDPDPTCPVHGEIFYPEKRKQLVRKQWEQIKNRHLRLYLEI